MIWKQGTVSVALDASDDVYPCKYDIALHQYRHVGEPPGIGSLSIRFVTDYTSFNIDVHACQPARIATNYSLTVL